MQIKEWLNSLPGSPTVSQAADTAGVSKATFLRHEKKGETTAEYVIAIARTYEVNEIQALIDLGFVRQTAVETLGIEQALRLATNSQILAELDRRLDPEARRLYRAEGVDDVVDLADDFDADAQVFDFPHVDVAPVGEDGVPLDAVADSSPEEGDGDPGAYEP